MDRTPRMRVVNEDEDDLAFAAHRPEHPYPDEPDFEHEPSPQPLAERRSALSRAAAVFRILSAGFALLILSGGTLAAYMAWRTSALLAPQTRTIVAMPRAQASTVDTAEAAARLSEAIRAPTHTLPNGYPEDPDAFDAFHSWLETTYPAFHAVATRDTFSGFSLLYTWPGADATSPPVLLVAHLDAPRVDGAVIGAWRYDPFAGVVADGAVWGRGAQTGKGPLIAMLEAANALAASDFEPRRTIMLAVAHDGGVRGDNGAASIVRRLKRRGVKAWFAVSEGQPIMTAHPFTEAPAGLVGVTEKRELALRVSASGQGAVSALTGRADAVAILTQALTAIASMKLESAIEGEPNFSTLRALAPSMTQERAVAVANSWLLGGWVREQIVKNPDGADLLATTIAPTLIQGGETETAQPDSADAVLHVRLHPRDTPEAILASAEAAVQGLNGVKVEWAHPPGPAIPTASTEAAAYHLLASLVRDAGGGDIVVAPALQVGASDGRHYVDVAENVYRVTPALWTRQDIRSARGVNERISLENLERMIGFYTRLLSEAAG